MGEFLFNFCAAGVVGAFAQGLAVCLRGSTKVIIGMIRLGIHQQNFVFRNRELLGTDGTDGGKQDRRHKGRSLNEKTHQNALKQSAKLRNNLQIITLSKKKRKFAS